MQIVLQKDHMFQLFNRIEDTNASHSLGLTADRAAYTCFSPLRGVLHKFFNITKETQHHTLNRSATSSLTLQTSLEPYTSKETLKNILFLIPGTIAGLFCAAIAQCSKEVRALHSYVKEPTNPLLASRVTDLGQKRIFKNEAHTEFPYEGPVPEESILDRPFAHIAYSAYNITKRIFNRLPLSKPFPKNTRTIPVINTCKRELIDTCVESWQQPLNPAPFVQHLSEQGLSVPRHLFLRPLKNSVGFVLQFIQAALKTPITDWSALGDDLKKGASLQALQWQSVYDEARGYYTKINPRELQAYEDFLLKKTPLPPEYAQSLFEEVLTQFQSDPESTSKSLRRTLLDKWQLGPYPPLSSEQYRLILELDRKWPPGCNSNEKDENLKQEALATCLQAAGITHEQIIDQRNCVPSRGATLLSQLNDGTYLLQINERLLALNKEGSLVRLFDPNTGLAFATDPTPLFKQLLSHYANASEPTHLIVLQCH